MVWNEWLKREVPKKWLVKNIFDVVSVLYGFPFDSELFTELETDKPIVRIRDIIEGNTSTFTTEIVNENLIIMYLGITLFQFNLFQIY